MPFWTGVCLVFALFLIQISQTQSDSSSPPLPDAYVTESSPSGEINVYTNPGNGTADEATPGPLAYSVDSSGDMSINVTALWLYYTETGDLPTLPPELISLMGDVVNTLDVQGTADLFRNEAFLDSFVAQLNSSFPEWIARFNDILASRDAFLEGLGVDPVAVTGGGGSGAGGAGGRGTPAPVSSDSNTAALVVGIVLAVVAVVVVIVCAVLYIVVRRRRRGAAAVMDGGIQGSKAFSTVSGSTYYDDALSLKSATTLLLAQDIVLDGSAIRSQQSQQSGSVVGKLSADPVLRWVMEQAGEMPTSEGRKLSASEDGSQGSNISESLREGSDRPDGLDCGGVGRSVESTPSSGSVSSMLGASLDTSVVTKKTERHPGQIPDFLSNLQFRWGELKVARSLGSGAYGKVYLARWNETPVAVKVLLDGNGIAVMDGSGHSPSPHRMLEEIKITAALRHPNVVQFMGFCLSPPSMAAEYCPRGSLYSVLHGQVHGAHPEDASPRVKTSISWLRRVAFAADGAAGMLHLHTRNPLILHRDLNSPNLLVSADWTVKVADMGLSKLLTDSALECGINSVVTSGGGVNPRWLAPEILRGENCTRASDVFSFGVIMWEILTRRVPWEGETTWSIVGQVQNGGRLRVDDEMFEHAEDMDDETVEEYIVLMQSCWDQDPDKRPEFGTIAASLRELQKKILDAL